MRWSSKLNFARLPLSQVSTSMPWIDQLRVPQVSILRPGRAPRNRRRFAFALKQAAEKLLLLNGTGFSLYINEVESARAFAPEEHLSPNSDAPRFGVVCKARCWAIAVSALLALSPSLFGQAQATAPTPRFVVVLNPAHGGDDAGANLDGQPEKAFTLAMSIRLRSLLAARGIDVITTRESDVTLDSVHRAQIANHARAQA